VTLQAHQDASDHYFLRVRQCKGHLDACKKGAEGFLGLARSANLSQYIS
jgi:hypothetical protein